MRLRSLTVMAAAVLALAVAGIGVGHAAMTPAAIVAHRQKLMKQNLKDMKAIAAMVKGKAKLDRAAIKADASAIAKTASEIPSLFPKGSVTAKSRAKPVIWTKWSNFETHGKTLQRRATKLAEISATAPLPEIGATLKHTGAACGACHKAFRAKKK